VVVGLRLRKARWKHAETGATCHSRPPDDAASVRSCTLVVVLKLWAWVSSPHGLWRHRAALPSLDPVVSSRTLQRWMRRALELAATTEQACRFAVLESYEPRPGESLLPEGRGPPDAVFHRWPRPAAATTLYRALAIILRGAAKLLVPTARLLAVARRRWTGPSPRFVV
jgi:hypothetical protein